MSNIHHRNLENEYDECSLCLDPWPCPPAVSDTERRDALRAEIRNEIRNES